MNRSVVIGVAMLAVGAALIFIAFPDKNHESPRFLRFQSASVIYPPLVLAFLVGGLAELLAGL